jgi:predicted TPR repeat methyltransferase
MAMGNKKQAADYFLKALKLRPDFEEAKYLLCVVGSRKLTKEQLPKSMPESLAVEYFDAMAPDYNNQQLQVLKYEGHIELDNSLRACTVPGRMDHILLELGVGTGLCGPGIRDIAAHLTGVDFSGAMLDQAVGVLDRNNKKIYDALIKRDALDFLKDAPDEGYDVVMSAGMFSYIGDISEFFEQIARVLKSKGLFAFTADVLEGEGYEFVPKEARFAFSKPYLDELIARNGFQELRLKNLAVYADYPAWVCVLQKP